MEYVLHELVNVMVMVIASCRRCHICLKYSDTLSPYKTYRCILACPCYYILCLNRLNKKQIVKTLIRRRVLRRLIWIYTICSCLPVRISRVNTAALFQNCPSWIFMYVSVCLKSPWRIFWKTLQTCLSPCIVTDRVNWSIGLTFRF